MHRNFTNIRLPITDDSVKLRTDGIYFAKDIKYKSTSISRIGCDYLIFYPDGTIIDGDGSLEFSKWDHNKFDILYRHEKEFYDSKRRDPYSRYGAYTIKDSILLIQSFAADDSYRRGVVNTYFRIINDSTISQYYRENTFKQSYIKCDSCFEKYTEGRHSREIAPPIEYSFHKYEGIDSCHAWFYKKSWYIMNLHESRKR